MRGPVVLAVAVMVAIGPLPGTTEPHARPNVVLIVTDDQTYDSIPFMPWLSAQTDWVRFTNAFMPTPLCCPARATILTGRYAHHTRVMNNDDASRFQDEDTLATW